MESKFYLQLIVVFIIAFIGDLIACIHIQTLIDNSIAISAISILVLHLLPFFELSWVIDNKSWKNRFALLFCGGLGAAMGTTCFMLLK